MKNDYSIEKIRAEIVSEYETVLKKLDAHGELIESVLKRLPAAAMVSAKQADGAIIAATGSFDIHITGDQHTLAAAIRALRVNGFDREGRPPQPKESTFSGFYNHPSGACIWLAFTSKVCRRVKIGTQMVEQDIFETVCDEMILPEVRPQQAAV